ncbi:MAG: potassium transporter TrkG [Hyphomonas sp.]
MNYSAVFRILSWSNLIFVWCGTVLAIAAAVMGERQQAFSFAAMAIGIVVVSSSILLLTPKPSRPARAADALAVIVLWWLSAPVATALPFVVGVADTSLIRAVHEAASCLTTTGHSVIAIEGDRWPSSLLMWRGLLHLIGAWASIVIAASVFAALNLGGPGIHRTELFTVPETSFFDSVPRVARAVAVMLGVSVLVISSLLFVSGESAGRGLADAISVVTTGLVLPQQSMLSPTSYMASMVLTFGLIIGTLGLVLWLPLARGRPYRVLWDPEAVLWYILVAVFTGGAMLGGFGVLRAFGWSISSLSTSGIPLTYGAPDIVLPLSIAVLPALIGGSALSAAGGVKLARLVILVKRTGQEFKQLGYRRSILKFDFRGRELDERSVIGVWVYLVAYVFVVIAAMLALSFMYVPFESAVRFSIGGLSNSGALISGDTEGVSQGVHLLMIFTMILGRLEVLALIPALSLSFWRG